MHVNVEILKHKASQRTSKFNKKFNLKVVHAAENALG